MPIQVTCGSCKRSFNAPDAAAGKRAKCPKCGSPIDIPVPAPKEEILDAEVDGIRPFSDEDFEVEPPPALPEQDDRRPCPMCGEMIQRNAVKCRHCGEIFDPLLKAQAKKGSSSYGTAPDSDSDLSALDWVLCILCSGIACIMAIIYIIQGKPKGTKMLLVSLAVQGFWVIVRVVLVALTQNQN